MALLAACASPTTPYGAQKRFAEEVLTPASLDDEEPGDEELVRPAVELRVRAWADEGYRGQVRGWEARIARLLERSNRVLEPRFGVSLRLVEVRAWDRHGAPSRLDRVVDDLTTVDRGVDVDLVVGFTAAFEELTGDADLLGAARLLTPYLAVRAMYDQAEARDLERTLDRFSERERWELLEARIRHKELAVFLHELGHAFGALHTPKGECFMGVAYDPKTIRFAEPSARLIELSLAERLGARYPRREETMTTLLAYLRETHWEGWSEVDRELLIARLEMTGGQAPRHEAGTPADAASEVMSLVEEGRVNEALDRALPLEPLLACRIGSRAGVDAARRAKSLARCGAVTATTAAGRASLAQAYQAHDAPSLAESLGAQDVLQWALDTRRAHGMPKGAVAAAEEPAYLSAERRIVALIDAKKIGEARAALEEASARWPKVPGLDAAQCRLQLALGKVAAAKAACKRALATWEETAQAHVLLAAAAAATGDREGERRHSERALALGARLIHRRR